MEKIRQCIEADMQRFEVAFSQALRTQVPLADDVVRYFLGRRGKQLRPVMTLLAAKAVGGEVTEATLHGAVALELLHNASLMHDDVIDQSDRRRGADTINKLWDNRVAILMGDFFLSRVLFQCNAIGSMRVTEILSEIIRRLSEGELEQLANVRSRMFSEEAYFKVIGGKTASLFNACMRIGAISVGASEAEEALLARVGELMGLIFQIRDDIFDYYPSTDQVGKPTGHDIREGKVTLPLLYALQHAPQAQADAMKDLLNGEEPLTDAQVDTLVTFARTMGGIDYAQRRMDEIADEAQKLLKTLPNSPSRQALDLLIGYFIRRNH